MDIIGSKYIFLSFSGLLVAASLAAIFLWGLSLGVDFTGGSLLEAEFIGERPSLQEISAMLAETENLGNVAIQPEGEKAFILRFPAVEETVHQNILTALGVREGKAREKLFVAIGPSIGRELKQRSTAAILLTLAAIILYITFAFRRVSKPVSSWKYGVVAVAALIHDVAIPSGVFAALGRFGGVEIDALFVTALLTILGFSVHDTIVVFDRIRENLRKLKTAEPYEVTVNRSVNETFTRSLNTSLTVLMVLVAVMALGGESTRYFALALSLGVIFGTYSSIFVASPLLVLWHNWTRKK
jgi:preprotein translocase subunit SecF